MNNKEKQDYLKHCCEHFEILTGGRGHSKTKEVIEDMQKEIERLTNIVNKIEDMLQSPWNIDCVNQNNEFLNKIKALKEGKENDK